MTRLATIVSTGDPGAARGALESADELGLKVGGWTAVTALPAAYAERLKPTLAPRMAARLNVQDSDGTLIVSFAPALAAGSPAAYADEAIEHQRKPSLHIVLPDGGRSAIPEDVRKGVLAWIAEEKIATLHVTGPREAEEPGIQAAVRDALVWIFEDEVRPPTFLPRATFEGVDCTAAPERLVGVVLAGPEPEPGSVVDTIARIAADLPSRPMRPPLTTEDALRQVAHSGSDDAKLLALAELARRAGTQPTHIAINPATVDAAIAAGLEVVEAPPDAVVLRPLTPYGIGPGLDRVVREHSAQRERDAAAAAVFELPPPVPPEVWAARDRMLAEATPAGRTEVVLQATREGRITQEQARSLLGMPQLEPPRCACPPADAPTTGHIEGCPVGRDYDAPTDRRGEPLDIIDDRSKT